MPDPRFQAPKGTHDVLPPDSQKWAQLISAFGDWARRYGFGLLISPILEHREVFERIGEGSEIVRKEMYELTDRGDRRLVLRPEGTAPAVRAFVQHRPSIPWKVWYAAPSFRYERPQKGRYRQHHQLGAEALGTDDAELDIEVIDFATGFLKSVGIHDVELLINSLGDPDDRPAYLAVLGAFLEPLADQLCEECNHRLEGNVLRVLDCKRQTCREATKDAPVLHDYLGPDALTHFNKVRAGLDGLGISYVIAPRLVRGLDYYVRTTFEITSPSLDAAQNALGGGGRYDGLVEAMGGPPTPGIGFGLGIERIIVACEASEGTAPPSPLDVFVADAGAAMLDHDLKRSVVAELRQAGFSVDQSFGVRSLEAQLKVADRSGARFAMIIGSAGDIKIKDFQSRIQENVARDNAVSYLGRCLSRVNRP